MFVEFANKISVARALKLSNSGLAVVLGIRLKIFRAGSGTYVYSNQKKKKVIGNSRTNVFNVGSL